MTAADLREARAELQKMQAEMADDKAFGMFSPALQQRITATRKAIADMTVEVGKQNDALKKLAKEEAKLAQEEQRTNRIRLAGVAALVLGYKKLESSISSLRSAGMANTVEANRQEVAYTLLGREIAAVFLPATTASTNASLAGAKALANLSESGQNVLMVLSYATAGLITFTTAQLAAAAAGIRLTGVLAGVARWLPLIGLAAGAVVALGTIFLSSEEGASMLNSTLEETVELMNKLGKEAETFKRMTWTEYLGTKGIQMLEWAGMLKKGVGDTVVNALSDIQERDGRGKKKPSDGGRKVHPTTPRFENIGDSFERLQLAAAKLTAGKDVPQQQLEVAKQQLEELKKQNANKDMPTRAKIIAGLAVP